MKSQDLKRALLIRHDRRTPEQVRMIDEAVRETIARLEEDEAAEIAAFEESQKHNAEAFLDGMAGEKAAEND